VTGLSGRGDERPALRRQPFSLWVLIDVVDRTRDVGLVVEEYFPLAAREGFGRAGELALVGSLRVKLLFN
jgi:hypothetical protein